VKKHILRCLSLLFTIIVAVILISCENTGASVDTDTDALTETAPDSSIGSQITTETEPAVTDTEPVYDFTTDPLLYEPLPEKEYGLSENTEKRPCAFELEGTLKTATGTSLNLMVEWKATRKDGNSYATVDLNVAIEHKKLNCLNSLGHLTVNGHKSVFMAPFYDYEYNKLTREWLCPVTLQVPCGYGEEAIIDISAEWEYYEIYEGRRFRTLTLDAKIPIGEKYAALKEKVNYEVENILQQPELPEGCEVTSLAILLNHLGFDVKHTYLADNYLEQGEVGEVSFYEMNVGNPRHAGKAYGCYSPVIVKTANKYLYDMRSYYRAYDYTGYDVSEIYYQLSMGHPVIVWITMDFAEPYIKKPWNIGGKEFYWIYPLHCVLMTGYDMKKGTVTLTDPLKKSPVTVNMELFEKRFMQIGSQAVVIKASQPANK